MSNASTPNPATDREVRLSGLGGSDAAKVFGVSRFGGRWELYQEKLGMTAPLVETERMAWGKRLEDIIARTYAEQTGRRVRRVNRTIRHPDYPFLFAHVDRAAGKGRGLEVKTAGIFMASDFGEPGSDQVPPDYLLQVMHYMMVTGWEVFDLAVLIGGQNLRIYTIPRDEQLIADLLAGEVDFWQNHVVPRIPPEVDGSEAATEYLSQRYADNGTERPMDDQLELLAREYVAVQLTVKSALEQKELLANQIRELMGDDARSRGGNVSVRWSTVQAPARIDWQGIAQELGISADMIARYTNRGESVRRLSVSVKEDT